MSGSAKAPRRASPSRAAASLRSRAANAAGTEEPADLLREAARLVGVSEVVELSSLSVQGALQRSADIRRILVRRGDSRGRRNYTVAHEIGHCVAEREGVPEVGLERWCESFAAEFLMPARIFRQEYIRRVGTNPIPTARYLTDKFEVSFTAYTERLNDLNFYKGLPTFLFVARAGQDGWTVLSAAYDRKAYRGLRGTGLTELGLDVRPDDIGADRSFRRVLSLERFSISARNPQDFPARVQLVSIAADQKTLLVAAWHVFMDRG